MFVIITNASFAHKSNGIHTVTQWNIPSNHYVCLCTPTQVAKYDAALNATNWDNVCSNLQVCSWNKHEVLVRTWYHEN